MKKSPAFFGLLTLTALADPRPQMNLALTALSDLLPFLSREERFLDKKNENEITMNLAQLEKTFQNMKHDHLLKNDLFAPSYQVIRENLAESVKAFRDGNKDYAHWRLSEVTRQCLDCHTRLPESYSSNYQDRKLVLNASKFQTLFDLGTAQLLVRDYRSAEKTFEKVIEENIQKKNFMDTEEAFKNLLLIRTRVHADYKRMLKTVELYSRNKNLPMDIQEELESWGRHLKDLDKNKVMKGRPDSDKDVKSLIATVLAPVKDRDALFLDNYDVYLLAAGGHLSRYLFANPQSDLAPEISYWLGWSEKILKREDFFGSGDNFFRQCIRRYPKSELAPKCLKELKESVEFEFSGSAGTNVPADLRKELAELEALTKRSP